MPEDSLAASAAEAMADPPPLQYLQSFQDACLVEK